MKPAPAPPGSGPPPIYVLVWEYQVKPGCEAEFESIYGQEGDWARLFATGEGYLGTDLLRDPGRPGRYLTLDFWIHQPAYESFRAASLPAYQELDQRCESLTLRETPLGSFSSAGHPGRRFRFQPK